MKRLSALLEDFQITSSLGLLAFVLVVGTAITFVATLALAQYHQAAIDASYGSWVDKWLTFLEWLLGFVVAGVVGKRATAKPEVIDAETRQAVATGSVPPPSPSAAADPAPPPPPPPPPPPNIYDLGSTLRRHEG